MIDFNKPDKKIVDILGTPYIFVLENRKDNPLYESNNSDGYCDSSVHEIHVAIEEPTPKSDMVPNVYRKAVARHEIVHAFLHESGLSTCSGKYDCGWSMNEEMVDWIALQAPKMAKVFSMIGCYE